MWPVEEKWRQTEDKTVFRGPLYVLKSLVPGPEPTCSRGAPPSSLAVRSPPLGSLRSGPQAASFLRCTSLTAGSTEAGLPGARIPPSFTLAVSLIVIEDKEEREDEENGPQKQKERSWSQTTTLYTHSKPLNRLQRATDGSDLSSRNITFWMDSQRAEQRQGDQ